MITPKQLSVFLAGTVLGVLGVCAYEHYQDDGSKLTQALANLAVANENLAKAEESNQLLKAKSDAELAQIQQLTSSEENLNRQLLAAKSAPVPAPVPGTLSPVAQELMKTSVEQQHQDRLLLLKTRLHLTPEQEAAVKAAMNEEAKLGQEMMSRAASGGKIDPQTMAAMAQNTKTVEQTLKEVLTPDQITTYQQMQNEQNDSAQENMALHQMNQLVPLLQLTDSQQDQVYTTLYQLALNRNSVNQVNPSNPTAYLDAEADAKENALSKILTPDQMAIYHQQAQSKLATQKAMVLKVMPQ